MKVYIAGPMRGYKELNFPAFFEAESVLRDIHGYEPINPARMDIESDGLDPSEIDDSDPSRSLKRRVFERDTRHICQEADALYMLRGWEYSLGAVAEHSLAKAIGLDVIYQAGDRL